MSDSKILPRQDRYKLRLESKGLSQLSIWLQQEEKEIVDNMVAEMGLKNRSELFSYAVGLLKKSNQAK